MRDEDSPPLIRYPEWQPEYQAAIIELDRRQLAKRVAEAEAAIAKRFQAISRISCAPATIDSMTMSAA
jgi:hypothetical protein